MLRNLLICGLIAGLCGGLLATGFARIVGEPQVDKAIAFESAKAKAAGEPAETPLVSRTMQKSLGLLTAAVVYGLSLGGLFGIAFALAYGRVGRASPAPDGRPHAGVRVRHDLPRARSSSIRRTRPPSATRGRSRNAPCST